MTETGFGELGGPGPADEPMEPRTLSEPSPPAAASGYVSAAAAPASSARSSLSDAAYVYALGSVEPRFPSLGVEREYAQALGRYNTEGKTELEALQSVLSKRENRYLARQMCWVFSVERLPTYVLVPRDPADVELLTDAMRSSAGTDDLDVVIGLLGPLAPPEACGGLVLPVVAFDQIYSFSRDELIDAIPLPEGEANEEHFRQSAAELFDRFLQVADNAGATDEHRALNYVALRYSQIYANAMEAHRAEKSLTGIEVRPSRLSGPQRVLDVIIYYTHRRTDVTDAYFIRVDVSGEFPFLVSKLQSFFGR
jgi:PatG C-terminal